MKSSRLSVRLKAKTSSWALEACSTVSNPEGELHLRIGETSHAVLDGFFVRKGSYTADALRDWNLLDPRQTLRTLDIHSSNLLEVPSLDVHISIYLN